MNYTIEQYLKYQNTIKIILLKYIYIGDYSIDDNTQFLWRRIYLSNGEFIHFDSNEELMNYINDNYVKEFKFVDEE
jgi:hypothetical protein